MSRRTELNGILNTLLGSSKVYFQPPTGLQLSYPCIIYKLNDVDSKFADNKPYSLEREYLITIIDKNPDTALVDKVLLLPKCTFDRHFTSDNLNHYVFRIFY